MKYLSFYCDHLVDGFCILPSLDVSWMTLKEGRFWDIRFCWLFWFATFGQINKKLKEDGY